MRVLLLHGLGFVLILRAEYAAALAAADRADALRSESEDLLLQVVASTVRGHVYMMQGRPRESRESFERALAAHGIKSSSIPCESFIADPQVTALAALSLQLTHLGLIGQARERLAAGLRASPPAGTTDGADGRDLVRRAVPNSSWRRGRRGKARG